MSEQYEDQNQDTSGQDQTEGGAGGGGEENNEADMIFAPEASKPGRNAGMLMIAFVMIGVGVIYFMRVRTGPATVIASDQMKQAEGVIKGFDNAQVKKMKDLLRDTQKVVEIMNGDRNGTHEEQKLERNPFVQPNTKTSTDPNAGDKDQKRAKAEFMEGMDNLRVQYIMVSQFAKTAMINNKLVQEGQEVEGYTVEKITPQECIFSKSIRTFSFKAAKSTSKELK